MSQSLEELGLGRRRDDGKEKLDRDAPETQEFPLPRPSRPTFWYPAVDGDGISLGRRERTCVETGLERVVVGVSGQPASTSREGGISILPRRMGGS